MTVRAAGTLQETLLVLDAVADFVALMTSVLHLSWCRADFCKSINADMLLSKLTSFTVWY